MSLNLPPPSGEWTDQDRVRTMANLAARLRQVLGAVADDLAAGAVRDELDGLDRQLRATARVLMIAGSGGQTLEGTFTDQLAPLDTDEGPPDALTLAARIGAFAGRIPELVDRAASSAVVFRSPGRAEQMSGADLLAHAVDESEWSLHRLGRLRASSGDGPRPGIGGELAGIHASDGGVPKHPVPQGRIEVGGLEGDRQATRRHHGRPWQAVSLWSADVIDEMAAEGHPVGPGTAGENLTVRGLDWKSLRPGVQVGVGPVVLELTAWAEPCSKIANLFVDGRSWWLDHDRYPGRARVYARVVRPGNLAVGDPVVIEPQG